MSAANSASSPASSSTKAASTKPAASAATADRLAAGRLSAWLGSAGVLLMVFVIGAALAGVKFWQITQMSSQGPPPEAPTVVGLAPAVSAVYRQASTAIGTVLAPRSIVLSNEVAGTVARSNLPAGEVVEEGTLLLELDISIEMAQLEAAQAAAAMAESRYIRTREARRNNALTELELDEARGQWVQAQARVSELQATVEAAQTRLRPVLITSAATAFGHFPLVIVEGPGAMARKSIGIVLVAGMLIGTCFTLFVVPCLYLMMAADRQKTASWSFDESELSPAEKLSAQPSAA